MYFDNCYTPDELKLRYRDPAKQLHPDKGGSKAQFQEMLNQYEQAKQWTAKQQDVNTMPEHFNSSESYEYFRRPVTYAGVVYNHYYKFTQVVGADILIDAQHLNLIFRKHKAVS